MGHMLDKGWNNPQPSLTCWNIMHYSFAQLHLDKQDCFVEQYRLTPQYNLCLLQLTVLYLAIF